jgi:biotin synthase
MTHRWESIETKALNNVPLSTEEALSVLTSTDDQLLELVGSARRVREKFFGKRVKLNYLVNVKSGLCPEDCHYCSQSKDSEAPIPKYPLMTPEEIVENTERGLKMGAKRACLVASGRGPSNRELGEFCDSIKSLKDRYPNLEICACLGLLSEGQPEKLKDAGVYAYNHNINTSEAHYEKICGTHGYKDRLDTMQKAQSQGLSACSGVLIGMGETDRDVIDMATVLRERGVDSIPVNFLVSIDATPLQKTHLLTPQHCLRVLALMRFTNPSAEIRIAGGRELNLRTLQPLGLMIANSIFIGDYLTTLGQSPKADLEMIRDLGYVVEGQPDDFLSTVLSEPSPELKTPAPVC